jgi:hypothetical protein
MFKWKALAPNQGQGTIAMKNIDQLAMEVREPGHVGYHFAALRVYTSQ